MWWPHLKNLGEMDGLNCIPRMWIGFSLFLFAFLRDLFIFPRWCWHLYYPKNPNCDEYDSGSQWGSILSRYFLPRFTIVRDYSPWIPAFCNPLCHWDFLSLSPAVLSLWSPNEGSWPIVLGWVSMTNLLSSRHSPPISHTSLSHNNTAAAHSFQGHGQNMVKY